MMKNKNAIKIAYFIQYKDSQNKNHYTINYYNQSDKTITNIRDYRFN